MPATLAGRRHDHDATPIGQRNRLVRADHTIHYADLAMRTTSARLPHDRGVMPIGERNCLLRADHTTRLLEPSMRANDRCAMPIEWHRCPAHTGRAFQALSPLRLLMPR